MDGTQAALFPSDSNALAYGRTPQQVHSTLS